MWYKDLSECDYFGDYFPVRLAVGWLEKGEKYTKGECPEEVVEKIYELNKTSGMYVRFCGFHECDFCDFLDIELGATTIIIIYEDKVYLCPALIVHYIKEHDYLPPSEFIEAVTNYDYEHALGQIEKAKERKFPYLRKKNESNNRTN